MSSGRRSKIELPQRKGLSVFHGCRPRQTKEGYKVPWQSGVWKPSQEIDRHAYGVVCMAICRGGKRPAAQ